VHPPLSRWPGLCLHPSRHPARMRSVLSRCCQRNPSTHPGRLVHGEPMSLYRAGLRFALFLPLGVAMPLSEESAVRFRRCELRFQPTLTDRRDPLIEPPSASPRLQDLRTYPTLWFSRCATRGAGKTPRQRTVTLNDPARRTRGSRSCERVP